MVKPSPECRRRAGRNGRGMDSARSPQGQGRAGERRGSSEFLPRRAGAPRTVRTGLSSEAGKAGAKKGSGADRLRRVRSEGTPHVKYTCGARSPGCPFFRFLSLGTQRKEPVVRGWVSREKASVRGTLTPANGLATDGKHRTCKREHGERSAASPVVKNLPVGDSPADDIMPCLAWISAPR